MKIVLSICIITNVFGFLFAQESNSQSVQSQVEQQRERAERERLAKEQREKQEQGFRRMQNITNPPPQIVFTSRRMVSSPTLSKEEKEAQKKLLKLSEEDSIKYANFLKLPKTGFFKLFPDLGCYSKVVIKVDGDCANIVPISSSYSFRQKGYLSPFNLYDLKLKNETFLTESMFSNGIIVKLGNIPIENVSAASEGIKFLMDYQPANDNSAVLAKSSDLAAGVKDGNYFYATSAPMTENSTYGLRVIAYRGKIFRQFAEGLYFDLLEKDKRKDIIVVFQVVRKEENGVLTLLWRELQNIDSPKINLTKAEQDAYLERQ